MHERSLESANSENKWSVGLFRVRKFEKSEQYELAAAYSLTNASDPDMVQIVTSVQDLYELTPGEELAPMAEESHMYPQVRLFLDKWGFFVIDLPDN